MRYSYAGECSEISRHVFTETLGGRNNSYNITNLRGHLNYGITLTAINGTGTSPPNMAFTVTRSTRMHFELLLLYELCDLDFFLLAVPTGAPQMFTAALIFSTNVTMQWQRVRCSERNSEIARHILQHSLVGSETNMTVGELGTNDSNRMYTATSLQPLSRYTFTIAAVNSDGQTGPDRTVTVSTTAPESEMLYLIFNSLTIIVIT